MVLHWYVWSACVHGVPAIGFSHFHCFPAPALTDFCFCFTVFWCLLLSWRDTFHNFHCFLLFPMVSNGFLWFSDSYLCYCQIALVLSLVFFVVFHWVAMFSDALCGLPKPVYTWKYDMYVYCCFVWLFLAWFCIDISGLSVCVHGVPAIGFHISIVFQHLLWQIFVVVSQFSGVCCCHGEILFIIFIDFHCFQWSPMAFCGFLILICVIARCFVLLCMVILSW